MRDYKEIILNSLVNYTDKNLLIDYLLSEYSTIEVNSNITPTLFYDKCMEVINQKLIKEINIQVDKEKREINKRIESWKLRTINESDKSKIKGFKNSIEINEQRLLKIIPDNYKAVFLHKHHFIKVSYAEIFFLITALQKTHEILLANYKDTIEKQRREILKLEDIREMLPRLEKLLLKVIDENQKRLINANIKDIQREIFVCNKHLDSEKNDHQYTILNNNYETVEYKRVESFFNENVELIYENVSIYSINLAYLFRINKALVKLTYGYGVKLEIETQQYFNTYCESFFNGKKKFDEKFSEYLSNVYFYKNEFYDELRELFFSKDFKQYVKGDKWETIVFANITSINHEKIKKIGFYAGFVSRVMELVKEYPTVFKGFFSVFNKKPSQYDTIDKDEALRIIDVLRSCDIVSFEVYNDLLIKEFARTNTGVNAGYERLNYFLSEFLKEAQINENDYINENDIKPEIFKIKVDSRDISIKFDYKDIEKLRDIQKIIQNNLLKTTKVESKPKGKQKSELKTAIECIILEIPERKETFLKELKNKYGSNTNIKEFARLLFALVHMGIIDINKSPRNIIKPAFERLFDKEIECFGNQKGFDKYFRDFNKRKEKNKQVFCDEFSTLISEINQLKQVV